MAGKKRVKAPARSKSRGYKKKGKKQDQANVVANAGYQMYGRVPNTPLPTKLKVNLRFAQNISLNPNVTGVATQVYRANDLYDPDFTGVGNQPRGFDQLMTLYDHFVVIGSKITVMMHPDGYTNSMFLAINLKDSSSADNNQITTLESSFTSYGMVSPEGPPITMVQTFAPSFLGRTSPLSDPDLKGSDSSSPNEQAFFHVVWASPAATDEGAAAGIAVIEYTAMLIEPKRPSQS